MSPPTKMQISEAHLFPGAPKLPQESWDSHMHIVDPLRFPIAKVAKYVPSTYTLEQALAFESTLEIKKVVLVQPSIFGTDNSCLLEGLKALGPARGRGVVVIDPENVNYEELMKWHEMGVRGLRINFVSIGVTPNYRLLIKEIKEHAKVAKQLGWAIQVYIPMHILPYLLDTISSLPAPFVIDHFGNPDLSSVVANQPDPDDRFDPYSIPGFHALMTLLKQGNTYVKVSASYRAAGIRGKLQSRYIDDMLREMIKINKHRLVFATDWPHTQFEGLDIRPFAYRVLELCREAEFANSGKVTELLFRHNAEELWDARP